MEIKVIDLLNIIADDKELPEKFMYKGHLYYKQKYNGVCYRCDELNEIFEECLVLEDLNDTIEIIGEPKKIEKIKSKGDEFYSDYIDAWISKNNTDAYCEFLMNKINELIDEINNLKEK